MSDNGQIIRVSFVLNYKHTASDEIREEVFKIAESYKGKDNTKEVRDALVKDLKEYVKTFKPEITVEAVGVNEYIP